MSFESRSCFACKGSGKAPCTTCNGTGKTTIFLNSRAIPVDCMQCLGTGNSQRTCAVCRGMGKSFVFGNTDPPKSVFDPKIFAEPKPKAPYPLGLDLSQLEPANFKRGLGRIFLSYAREDRVRAQQLMNALQAMGFSIWWDDKIEPGKEWRSETERALNTASCVVVLWSNSSVSASSFVKEEAEEGRKRGILVPVLIDNVEIPFGFRTTQCADLTAWPPFVQNIALQESESVKTKEFLKLTQAIDVALQHSYQGNFAPKVGQNREFEHSQVLGDSLSWGCGISFFLLLLAILGSFSNGGVGDIGSLIMGTVVIGLGLGIVIWLIRVIFYQLFRK